MKKTNWTVEAKNLYQSYGWLIDETFGSFRYTPPQRKDWLMNDFYMLGLLRGRSKSELTAYKTRANSFLPMNLDQFNPDDPEQASRAFEPESLSNLEAQVNYMIEEAADTLLPTLKTELENVLVYACSLEIRSVLRLNDPDIIGMSLINSEFAQQALRIEKYFKRLKKAKTKDTCYELALMTFHNGNDFMRLAKHIFENFEFPELHGGSAWVNVINAYIRLKNATTKPSLFVAIDHVYDLQHNTGTIFNKLSSYAKESNYGWIQNALDFKAAIKSPEELLGHVSPQMRKLAQQAIQVKRLT